MKVTGFGVGNFRSFGAEGGLVRDIGKVNVFIGKNNCGKSNVLRFLQFLSATARTFNEKPNLNLDRHKKGTGSDKALLGVSVQLDNADLAEHLLRHCYQTPTPTLDIWMEYPNGSPVGTNPLEPLNDQCLQRLHGNLTKSSYSGHPSRKQLLGDTWKAVAKHAKDEFQRMAAGLIYVPAIREIRNEGEEKPGTIDLSGRNLIKTLRRMQHPLVNKECEQESFLRIQKLVRELLGVTELVMEIPSEEDDIYLTMYGNRLPLAHYGTGVHELVIICTTLALHENCFVCIEEPEIHLHPELLRRFMRILSQTTNTYFIATHSNVLLDADETTAAYHVAYDGTSSRIARSGTNDHTRAILRDLCYRASDLLQTNGIIWVEGPSDRIYINRWLGLYGSKFVEGVNYSIMFYGGACLANLAAADCRPSEDLVELLRINSNGIVVIDRDGVSPRTALKAYKQRIQTEIGEDNCWVTQGREIENYLPPTLLARWLEGRNPGQVKPVKFGRDDKVEACVRKAAGKKSVNYACNKKEYAKEICRMMSPEDLDHLNLLRWIKRLHDAITKWNAG